VKTVQVVIEVDSKNAEKNLSEVNNQLNIQKKVLIDLEKELLKTESTQKSTSKTNLTAQKELTNKIKNLKNEIKLENLALKDLNQQKRKNISVINHYNEQQANSTTLIRGLDEFTGGYASSLKDVFNGFQESSKGVKFFIGSLSNMQKALIERFNSFLDTLGFLATAVKKVFERDFAGALEAVKQAGKESVDVLTGVNNSVDKVAEVLPKVTNAILDYAKSTYKAAAATIELNKQAEVAAVINQGLIEDYDRQAEQQRQIRDDTRNSLEVRIEANNKLGEILEEQQKLMLENADLILKAAENDLQKNNNQQNYIKLLQAENEKKAVLAQIEGLRSEQLVNQAALQQEVSDKVKEIDEAELKRKQEIAEKEIQLEKRKRESREMNALNAANTILGINSLFEGKTEEEQKKAFKRTKALNIAAALVETYLGAQKAFTSQIIPLDPTSPVRGGLAAAAAIAAGLGRVAQIRKQNFSGGSGGGGSTPISIGSIGSRNSNAAGVGFSPSTPTVNPIPTSSQIAAQGGQQSNVRAYVVQTDINNQTALDKRINQRATL
jgi:hypothetical protein